MAERKTRAELREDIVALISECTHNDEKPNEYIVKKKTNLITTESFSFSHVSNVIVHASCYVSAFLVVLDHLNDDDQAMVYKCLAEYTERVREVDVDFAFGEYFYCEYYAPEEYLHLYESGQGRSIKPAR